MYQMYKRFDKFCTARIIEALPTDEDCDIFASIESKIVQHHVLILHALERISKERHGRLMIFMPPGSAKPTYASVVFPSYFLGNTPNRRIILASYGDTLAKKLSLIHI